METLMSDLLATARGEAPKQPSYHFNTYHHADHFIADEIRLEPTSVTTVEYPTPASQSSNMDYTSSSGTSSDNESCTSPSYTSFYSPSGYSSSPTYIRGDFYNISPSPSLNTSSSSPSPSLNTPTSPSSPSHQSSRPFTSLSFSIDTILGSTAHNEEVQPTAGSPAIVTSLHYPSSQLYDWTVFQRMRHPSTSLPLLYWCHVCRSYCSSLADANNHHTIHTQNREPNNLRKSISGKHGYVTSHVQTDFLSRIKCGLCDRVVTKCFFNKHMRCHETLLCRVCGIECATQTRLDDHMNTHTGYLPYSCNTCGAQFSDRRKLWNHSRHHRASNVSCRFCQKTFKTKYTCTVHERIHTGSKPFACHVTGCQKAFPQKIQLQLHMRLHGQ